MTNAIRFPYFPVLLPSGRASCILSNPAISRIEETMVACYQSILNHLRIELGGCMIEVLTENEVPMVNGGTTSPPSMQEIFQGEQPVQLQPSGMYNFPGSTNGPVDVGAPVVPINGPAAA